MKPLTDACLIEIAWQHSQSVARLDFGDSQRRVIAFARAVIAKYDSQRAELVSEPPNDDEGYSPVPMRRVATMRATLHFDASPKPRILTRAGYIDDWEGE